MGEITEGRIACFVCGCSDDIRICIQVIDKGEAKYVCVRCLPVLIHGSG